MVEPDAELLRRRRLAQQQLAEMADQVRHLLVQVAGQEQGYRQQNDQVQALIGGTLTGADQAIARQLLEASSAIQQVVHALMAAEAQLRSASQI